MGQEGENHWSRCNVLLWGGKNARGTDWATAVMLRSHCGDAAVMLQGCCGDAAVMLWGCCGGGAHISRSWRRLCWVSNQPRPWLTTEKRSTPLGCTPGLETLRLQWIHKKPYICSFLFPGLSGTFGKLALYNMLYTSKISLSWAVKIPTHYHVLNTKMHGHKARVELDAKTGLWCGSFGFGRVTSCHTNCRPGISSTIKARPGITSWIY